ncbi:hypothetical protein Tco_1204550 [Tanacetum coccineum]
MDLYHSRLIQDDLNELIIKYKIPRDLYPWLPSEEFVMSELLDDVIGHRVYFSRLGPLGLNKVVTFEMLCRSLQIEPTVTLFRVFQTLCKQGHWFSFAKCRAPSPVCIDDNRLSAHVLKLRHIPEGMLVLSGLSRVWKSPTCDPILRGADGNVKGPLCRGSLFTVPPAAADALIPDPTQEDLAAGTPSAKVLAKANSSKKRKALLFGAASSHGSEDDDDACVEIPLNTPIRSIVAIPTDGNQSGVSTSSAAEGLNARDDRRKAIIEANLRGLLELSKNDLSLNEYLDQLGVSKLHFFFGCFGGDYTSSCPPGLNKLITFEVHCRSFQIEPTVTLFKVFQTLCKQGDWFSFAKRRAPSSRYPNVAIDDPRPAAGSFSMADVHRLSARVIKLRDMPGGISFIWVESCLEEPFMSIHDFLCLPEWTGAEVQEEPYLDVTPPLQRLPFYCTPPAAADAVFSDPTPEDLAIGTHSSRYALDQSSGSTTRPSLFVDNSDNGSDDDDDACVEIPLVTPIRSVAVIHSSGNKGGSSAAPATEGPGTRGGVAGNCEFTREE